MTKCRVAGKSLKHSAAVHTAPVLVICILPFGFGKCQPILAQAQHSSEPDMVCHSFLFQPYDVLSSRTFSHERPLAQPGGLFHVQLEHSPSHEDANRDRPEDAQFGLPHQRVLWDHSARDTCFHIPSGGLRCISWNTRGFFALPASSQRFREQKHIYFTRPRTTTSVVFKNRMGRILASCSGTIPSILVCFGTFTLNNVLAGGSAILTHSSFIFRHAN